MHGSKWYASHGLIGAVQYNSEKELFDTWIETDGHTFTFQQQVFLLSKSVGIYFYVLHKVTCFERYFQACLRQKWLDG